MSQDLFVKMKEEDFEAIKDVMKDLDIDYSVLESFDSVISSQKIAPKMVASLKKEYQLKRSKYYLGSDYLYRENLYFIRQYPEYETLLTDLKMESGCNENLAGIRTGRIGKPTETCALHQVSIDELRRKIRWIDEALQTIPEIYRKGVFEHIVYQTPYSNQLYNYANINTWKRWTQKFVYEVAVRRGQKVLIDKLKQFI